MKCLILLLAMFAASVASLSGAVEPWSVWEADVDTPYEAEVVAMDDGKILTLHPDSIELTEAVDRRGHLWCAGIEPGTFPSPKFQVGVALDNTDEDRDGFTYLLEDALHTAPDTADVDSPNRPIFEVLTIGGQQYLSIAYIGDSGGSGNNPYVTTDFEYYVEVSNDGETWYWDSTRVTLKDRFTISGRGTVNTLRSTTPISAASREFIRIRVLRR